MRNTKILLITLFTTIPLAIFSFFLLYNYIKEAISRQDTCNNILEQQKQITALQQTKWITEINYREDNSKAIYINKAKLIQIIEDSKLDIFLATRKNEVLKLKNEDIIAALFTVLLHESNFLRQKTNKSGDICYMQINKYYWNKKIRNALLDLDYTDKQILARIEACLETGIKVMLYNYALCKTNKKTDFEKLIVCYHSPYNKKHQTRYYNAIKKKLNISAIKNVAYKTDNIYYIKNNEFQKTYNRSASSI